MSQRQKKHPSFFPLPLPPPLLSVRLTPLTQLRNQRLIIIIIIIIVVVVVVVVVVVLIKGGR